jgi:hypothetical protein
MLPKKTVHYAHMRVISKPPDQTGQAARNVGPVIKGDGNMTYLCGDCETALLETVDYKLVRDLLVICKKCGKGQKRTSRINVATLQYPRGGGGL